MSWEKTEVEVDLETSGPSLEGLIEISFYQGPQAPSAVDRLAALEDSEGDAAQRVRDYEDAVANTVTQVYEWDGEGTEMRAVPQSNADESSPED